MARILVVEDDSDTREAVAAYLSNFGHEVHVSADGGHGLSSFHNDPVDVVILDIMLPTMSGIDLLSAIRTLSDVPILILTALSDEATQAASFDGLADDYVTKPFSLIILGKRVQALLRRTENVAFLDAEVWSCGDITVSFDGYWARNALGPIDITPREIEILRLLVDNDGLILSRPQILDHIWGGGAIVNDRLIDTYIKSLRKKLDTDCITTVRGYGYRFDTPRSDNSTTRTNRLKP